MSEVSFSIFELDIYKIFIFYIEKVIPLGCTQPRHLFHGEPYIFIYDPGRYIHNPIQQLDPFGSMVTICRELKDLVNQIENLQNQQLFVVLIFPDKTETEVRRFLMKYPSIQVHSYALYLIFPNGLEYHEEWINTPTMPKLRWCRSFTNRLIWDILDMCKSACDQSITFYSQKKIQAEDDMEHDRGDSTKSIVNLYGERIKAISAILIKYLQFLIDSDG